MKIWNLNRRVGKLRKELERGKIKYKSQAYKDRIAELDVLAEALGYEVPRYKHLANGGEKVVIQAPKKRS